MAWLLVCHSVHLKQSKSNYSKFPEAPKPPYSYQTSFYPGHLTSAAAVPHRGGLKSMGHMLLVNFCSSCDQGVWPLRCSCFNFTLAGKTFREQQLIHWKGVFSTTSTRLVLIISPVLSLMVTHFPPAAKPQPSPTHTCHHSDLFSELTRTSRFLPLL